MPGSQVVADWAWISKDPAAGIGYSVLKASTADVDFGAIMGRYVPGSPSSVMPESAPDTPPWVTFGPVAVSRDEVLMSVSVRDPWRDRDHAGRPVWPQRLLVTRFGALATADASYQTVWEAVRDVQVQDHDAAPLALTIRPQLREELLPVIEEYGFDRLAILAAALLEGPVAIADGSHLPRERRLAVLDAVAALLPYGLRADLSVSSSVNNTTQHGIRLVFASFANEGQQALSLLDGAPVAAGEVAQRYLATLHDKEQSCGLPALLEHLWRIKQPCSFGQPAEAVLLLAQLDYVNGVIRALKRGPIPFEEIAEFLGREAVQQLWKDLDERTRDNALTSLLADASPPAAHVLVRSWKFLRRDIIRRINDQLDAGQPEFAAWCLRAFRQAKDGEDRLLGDLLVPDQPIAEGERWNRRFTMLVELMRRREVPPPGEYRYACDQLRYGDASEWQARLVRELLTRELADSATTDRIRNWLNWLCRSPFTGSWERPDWLAALDSLEKPSPRADPSMRMLIRDDAAWTVLLLRLAANDGRLSQFLAVSSLDLVELAAAILKAGHNRPDPDLAAELVANTQDGSVRAETAAHVDTALVLLGGQPVYSPVRQQIHQWFRGYLAGLNEVFTLDRIQLYVRDLERWFLEYALAATETEKPSVFGVWLLNAWAADPARERGLTGYLAGLDPEVRPYDESLSEQYWHTVGQHPDLADYAAVGDVLTATSWTVRRPDVAFQRQDTGNGVKSTRLARACYEARCAGLSVEGIIRALAKGGAAEISSPDFDSVLREFQGLLFELASPEHRADERRASEEDLFACYQLVIVDAKLGREFAGVFGDYLDKRLEDEIKARQEMRKELSARRRSPGRVTAARNAVSRVFSGSPHPAPLAEQDSQPARRALPSPPAISSGAGDTAETAAAARQWEEDRARRS